MGCGCAASCKNSGTTALAHDQVRHRPVLELHEPPHQERGQRGHARRHDLRRLEQRHLQRHRARLRERDVRGAGELVRAPFDERKIHQLRKARRANLGLYLCARERGRDAERERDARIERVQRLRRRELKARVARELVATAAGQERDERPFEREAERGPAFARAALRERREAIDERMADELDAQAAAGVGRSLEREDRREPVTGRGDLAHAPAPPRPDLRTDEPEHAQTEPLRAPRERQVEIG